MGTTTPLRPFPSFLRLWGWPLAVAALSTSGLFTALVSDCWGDWWAWLALGLPVAVMAWFGLRRLPDSRSRRSATAEGAPRC